MPVAMIMSRTSIDETSMRIVIVVRRSASVSVSVVSAGSSSPPGTPS